MERLCLKLLKSSTDRDSPCNFQQNYHINETREKHVNASKGKTNTTILFLRGVARDLGCYMGFSLAVVRGSYSLVVVASSWGGFSC